MTEFRDQTLSDRVVLDGNSFVNVVFEGGELVYDGGVPPSFSGCRFNATAFTFQGAAGNTLMFLRGMAGAQTNMRDIVQGLIPELGDPTP